MTLRITTPSKAVLGAITLSVASYIVVLSIVRLNVVMLSVVLLFETFVSNEKYRSEEKF